MSFLVLTAMNSLMDKEGRRMTKNIDDFSRGDFIRKVLVRKPFLRKIYVEAYEKFQDFVSDCHHDGHVVEIGSGVGFLKEYVADALTTDVIPYDGLDRVVDATDMPFADNSICAMLLFHSFHHIPDVARFLTGAEGCLVPGGKLLIIDPHTGWIASLINKYIHHEGYDSQAREWKFNSTGPLSDANNALAWNVFCRDRDLFHMRYPKLRITKYETHSPLRYWISGGTMWWTLLPGCAFGFATWLDNFLIGLSPQLGSFVDVEIVKTEEIPGCHYAS
jgi:SAM-dependent methyltransferase